MASGRFVAYYRVSTRRQGASGLGLDAQKAAVKGYLNGGDLVDELVEIESGKRDDNRPKLTEALALCRSRGARLIIAKLDRLARNVAFISNLMNSGVEFVAVDMPHASRLNIHILAAVAEHEREMISQRTKAALAQAKSRGTKLGGDRGYRITDDHRSLGTQATKAKAADKAKDILLEIRKVQAKGITSASGIARELTKARVTTSRGKVTWQAAQVQRVLALMEPR